VLVGSYFGLVLLNQEHWTAASCT